MRHDIPDIWFLELDQETSLVGVFCSCGSLCRVIRRARELSRALRHRLRRAVRANAGATDAQGQGEAQLEAEERA
jgi:hypothetical protein